MEKFFLLLLTLISVIFAQVPPPPLSPPIFYLYATAQPPDINNLEEGNLNSVNLTSTFYYYLFFSCPADQNNVNPCVFNFSSIYFKAGSYFFTICNQTVRPNLCFHVVEDGETKLFLAKDIFLYNSDILDENGKSINKLDLLTLGYGVNISKGQGWQFFPKNEKRYSITFYKPMLTYTLSNFFCKVNGTIKDIDDYNTFGIPFNSFYFSIALPNGSSCSLSQKTHSLEPYFCSQDFPQDLLNYLRSRYSFSYANIPPNSFSLDFIFSFPLKREYSPYKIRFNVAPYYTENERAFTIESVTLLCSTNLVNYTLAGEGKVYRDNIEILATASEPSRNLQPSSFSTDFSLNILVIVNPNTSNQKNLFLNWTCLNSACTQTDFQTNIASNTILDKYESFSDKEIRTLIKLNTSSICPNGEKDNILIKAKGGPSSAGFEDKEIELYSGPCSGKIKFLAEIYKDKQKDGTYLDFELDGSEQNKEQFIIIKIKNLQNTNKVNINLNSKLFDGTLKYSSFSPTVASLPAIFHFNTFYDLKSLTVFLTPVGDDQTIFREFNFILEKPVLAIDKVKIAGSPLSVEQSQDLEKNLRLYLGERNEVDIDFVFLVPYKIKGYDFQTSLVPLYGGKCELSSVSKNADFASIKVRFKEKGCILKVRGVAGTAEDKSLSDWVSVKIYSKGVFVAQSPDSFCSSNRILSSQYFKFFLIAFSSLIVIIAIAFMLGSFTSNPRLLEWSKREIIETIILSLLIASIGFFLTLSCEKYFDISSIMNLFGLPQTKTISIHTPILDFAQQTMYNIIERVHSTIIILRRDIAYFHILGSAYTYSSSIGELILQSFISYFSGININNAAGAYNFIGVYNFLLNLNNFYLFNILVHYFLLFFLSSASGLIVFLLPIGLFFRCLPFVKNVGSALIAIGIGFYVLFPMAYVVYGLFLNSTAISVSLHCLVFSSDELCKSFNIYTQKQTSQSINVADVNKFISDKYLYMAELVEVGSFTEQTFPYPDAIFNYEENKKTLQPVYPVDKKSFSPNLSIYFGLSALNFLLAFFIPTIILVVVLGFVRDLASILGGDIDVSKLLYLA
ncbi:MAG: hypothetical protein N3D10_02245 [Candidatus Micrarchaeota archaeon]|nr:hypothetical protein [Candidatus Micrarchaeota archaeon]